MSDWIPGSKAARILGAVGTPLLYAAGAVALGMGLPRFEGDFLPDLVAPMGAGPAIALLSAIASGMLPLTALVFSLAFVMVQFNATAYSPRLVRGVDRPRRHREGAPAVLHRGGPAVIQTIDVSRLVALAEREGAVVALAWPVGDTLVDGMPLLRVHGGGRPVREHRLRRLVRRPCTPSTRWRTSCSASAG